MEIQIARLELIILVIGLAMLCAGTWHLVNGRLGTGLMVTGSGFVATAGAVISAVT